MPRNIIDTDHSVKKKMYEMHIYILVMKVACLEMWLEEQVETGCGCSEASCNTDRVSAVELAG